MDYKEMASWLGVLARDYASPALGHELREVLKAMNSLIADCARKDEALKRADKWESQCRTLEAALDQVRRERDMALTSGMCRRTISGTDASTAFITGDVRLIDADALHDFFLDTWGDGTDNTVIWPGDVLETINEAPTIYAIPVVRARWEYKPDIYDDGTYECSACGEPWTLYDGTPADHHMNFCPNCGARMNETEG